MTTNEKKFNEKLFTRIFDAWGKKTPCYEKHYELDVIKVLADFGKGTNEASDAKGKILGAGYEPLIMAFFIGLYSNKRVPFEQYADIKDLGQAIQFWGNIDSKKGRHAYAKLKDYIFVALVAKTPEIDWIALDKGERTLNDTVALLMNTMEEYINYGLSIIADKLKNDESYFYNKNSFIDIFKELTHPKGEKEQINSIDEPESLD